MNKEQQGKFANDLQEAIRAVLAKNGVMMATVIAGIDSAGNMVIRINQPKVTTATVAQPTPNAIARYQKLAGKLGLPKLGTILTVGFKEYALVGLSSDGSRVKARMLEQGGQPVVDLPLAAVKVAVSAAGAKQVAELDKAEQAQPEEALDPDVTAFLAAIGKATKPTEDGQ